MENRLKSYSICPSLPPFLTSISIFSLSRRLLFFILIPVLSSLVYPLFQLFSFQSFYSLFPILPTFSFIPPPIFLRFQLFRIFPSISSLSSKNCSSPFVLCSIHIPFFLIFQFFVPPHLLFPYISFLSSLDSLLPFLLLRRK